MHPKLATAYDSKGPFTKAIGTAQPLTFISMFWRVLFCGPSWTASSPSRRVNATSSRQHHSFGLCQEGRGDLQSRSHRDREEYSDQGSPDPVRILPVYIHTGENILADAASCFQEIQDWQLHPSVFQVISARWGLPSIDLFASRTSK
jgi:hypothetical protein